jgi:hypothetical protein
MITKTTEMTTKTTEMTTKTTTEIVGLEQALDFKILIY